MLIDHETGEINKPVIQVMRHQVKDEVIELRVTSYFGVKGVISVKVSRVVVRRVPSKDVTRRAITRG